jgi:outer membrane immunogenic protein
MSMAVCRAASINGNIMSITIVIWRSLAPMPRSRPRPIDLSAVVAAVLVLALSWTAAQAADLPVKAPVAPAYNWGGCYVGLNGGGGGSGTNFTTTVDNGTHLIAADAALVGANGTGSANATGFLGGGQVGCNWQTGTLVYGLEGDADDFHSNPQFINGTNTLSDGVTAFTATQSLTTDFFATVRPRIGIAADRNLAYLTGGAAFTKVNYTQSYVDAAAPAGTGSASVSKSLAGWTVGAGWEYAWTDHWTFRLEYLFASFPTTNALGAIVDTGGGTNPLRGSADLVIQTARAGVNFKF